MNTDGTAFTAGQSNSVELDVSTSAQAEVRINLPNSWRALAGDDHEVRDTADRTIVEFTNPVDGEGTRTVFVEVGADSIGSVQTVGPAEVTADVGEADEQQVWTAVPESESSTVVIGQSQP